MASYIGSNSNRFYAAREAAFGQAAVISSSNRILGHKLEFRHLTDRAKRPDKTGTRTYLGQDGIAKRRTDFQIRSYLTAWNGDNEPPYGALFASASGGDVELTGSNSIIGLVANRVQTLKDHGLRVGSAAAICGEIRFVTEVLDRTSFLVNTPFSTAFQSGSSLSATAGYRLGRCIPSLTLYDYWDPASALNRFVTGAAVNELSILVNGDYHEFTFSGPAADLFDSRTFMAGDAEVTAFSAEPPRVSFDSSGVPGHLGQAWIGGFDSECLTLIEATIHVRNNVGVRDMEFGSAIPRALVPGQREVSVSFTLLAQDNEQTMRLYSYARQRQCMPVMLQLGIQQGRLFGVYLPSVIATVPEIDDSDTRLHWVFNNNVAQVTIDEEIYMAFA